jgi:hypothetical protein
MYALARYLRHIHPGSVAAQARHPRCSYLTKCAPPSSCRVLQAGAAATTPPLSTSRRARARHGVARNTQHHARGARDDGRERSACALARRNPSADDERRLGPRRPGERQSKDAERVLAGRNAPRACDGSGHDDG